MVAINIPSDKLRVCLESHHFWEDVIIEVKPPVASTFKLGNLLGIHETQTLPSND